MAYIAPLSEKTLSKKYKELGLSDEQLNEINVLLKACSNLYGFKTLEEVWDVYKEASKKQPMEVFHRKNLYDYVNIAMRDDSKIYRILEINDVFKDEKPSDAHRLVVLKDLIKTGIFKFRSIYHLDEKQYNKPPFVPENIRLWVEPQYLNQGKKLIEYLGSLKVNCKESKIGFYNEKTIKTEHYGEYLKDFSYITYINRDLLKYYKSKKKYTKTDLRIIDDLSGKNTSNEAEALVKSFYEYSDWVNTMSPSGNIEMMFKELDELGVNLTESQINKILQLTMEYINNCNLCSNNGWKPLELAKKQQTKGPIHMTIGPGLQQAFAEGTLNQDELRKEMIELGIVPEF